MRARRLCAPPWARGTAIPCCSTGRSFAELREAPLDGGAKTVVRRHEARNSLHVVPPDEGCLHDVDTPEDYEALRG